MRLLTLLLMLCCLQQIHANTYYFSSSSGDDSRSSTDAQNPSSPWRSIEKFNQVFGSLNPGDVVLFNRGDVFTGSMVISRSGNFSLPITIGAYGSGAKPVINGFTTLSNWTQAGGGIWEAAFSSGSMVSSLLINGVNKDIGRYPNLNTPNKGYLNFESLSGNSSITDNELSGSPNWSGGEVVIKKNRWVLDRNQISSHSGNTINYISESHYWPEANFGYFIQNHPGTLDLEGEWYYKKNEGRVGVYLPASNPNAYLVQVSYVETLVSIINQGNIVFDNLSLMGANFAAFNLINAQNIRINGCDILYSGAFAVYGKECNGLVIEYSQINHSNNVALYMDNCPNTTIRNNTISNSGTVAGMGKGDSGSYEAIVISGDNVLIDHNSIENTGYIAVTFRGSYNVVTNNYINTFATVKDDASGVYSWNNMPGAGPTYGLKINNNLILNGIGAPEGTIWPGYRPASGIYMDDNVTNIEITNNYVANCGLFGIYIHNSAQINLQSNLFYNNAIQVVMRSDRYAPQNPIRNVNINNNILVAREYYQTAAEFRTDLNDIREFGNFDNNYYARPVDDSKIIGAHYYSGSYIEQMLTLDEWKAAYGKDANSRKSPIVVPGADYIKFEYNATASPKTIALEGNYVDMRNQFYSGSITIAPNTAVLLLSTTTVVPPATTDCPNTGGLLREQWNGIPGNNISSIPLNQPPTSTAQITALETQGSGDAYGARMRGYICAPQTGEYTFWVSGDDQVELWLSPDKDPANKKKIASTPLWTNMRDFTQYPSQKSESIQLQAGQLYYIEVLHKNGDGGNHMTVAWTVPVSGMQVPIPGNRLVPFDGNINPPNPPVSGNGLNYKYYEGNWSQLPDFNTLTPVKTGNTPNIDLSVKNVSDQFAILWEGNINIPTPGRYTFETVSDDGSKFYFNTVYNPQGTALVNNDGVHAMQSVSQSIDIAAAGSYPVAISFFEQAGGENMQLYWSGPGIPRQLVPNTAFSRNSNAACSATGTIMREIWQNIEGNSVNNIPLHTAPSITDQLGSLESLNLGEQYGVRMRGYICAPQTGSFTFMMAADDEAELWLSTDDNPANKVRIVNISSWTEYRNFDRYSTQRSGTINLVAGQKYYIEVLHKEAFGGDHATVAWQLPDGSMQLPISGAHLSPYNNNAVNSSATSPVMHSQADEINAANVLQLRATPNPFRTSSTIQLTPVETGDATVEVYTVHGVLVKRMFSGKVQAGVTKTLRLSSNGLSPGMYIIHLVTKTKVVSQKIILAK